MSEDPREEFRTLPDPVRPDELLETSDARTPQPEESELENAWRTTLLGAGG